jgi:transposase InsO family protein
VYCALRLNLPRRTKKRLPARVRQPRDAYLFGSIEEAQAISDEWLEDYNTERPHDSLGQVLPRSFLPRKSIPGESSFELSH